MPTKIGINGFGRIGRQVLRAIRERHPNTLEVVAINDLTDTKTNAHMFKYDTNYGVSPETVEFTENSIIVGGYPISVLAERDPSNLSWGKLGVDIVIESTGFFTSGDKASGHLKGGAKKVIISAPAKGEDITMVMGVNENQYQPDKHNVLSNASCTTNCIAPMAKILDDEFGINHGLMSTIHSYTNDQKVLDQVASDLRRARAAAMNIIPTSTGAAKAVGLVLPHLNGKIHGMAYRVPTSTVSVTDFTVVLNKSASVDDINNAYKKSAESNLKGILEYTDEPLVSSDFKQNTHSTIIDGPSTMSMDGSLVKVVGWYDNEWGYSCRTSDLANYIAKLGF
mgnify:FL=1|tara:strand:+ start:13398 stop:14411 length:1014 start_codon:yes stop_codon:yes gene_type:complete